MSFDTPAYVLFLAAVALVHFLCPQKGRRILLLAASLFFYACFSPPLTLLILAVVVLTWLCARCIEAADSSAVRQLWLWTAALGCMGLLFYFKYFNFLAGTISRLTGQAWTPLQILLPAGISFYTFQALSYVIDVYRRDTQAVRYPWHYALYVIFFPQLVAGPVERASHLLPQLALQRTADRESIIQGIRLLLSGFFRKLVIADLAAPAVGRVFAAVHPDGSAVVLGTILFSLQIYCDFAGYSEIAQGSALLVGIRLRRNFDRPYLAQTVRGFWRRWHISLTGWFRDYVYIPLGGNRSGKARQCAAVLTVFFLSGLWHGASWTFVLWGCWHGLMCAAEILTGRREDPGASGTRRACKWMLTAVLVLPAWVLFRAESVPHAFQMLGCLFSAWHIGDGWALLGFSHAEAICLALALAQLPLLHRLSESRPVPVTTYFYLALTVLLAWLLRANGLGQNAFIYFQF